MNTSVLHAMAMESAENVLCGTNVAQQNRQGGTEKFFRKNNWRMDTVLPVNPIRQVHMKWKSQSQKKR